MQPDQNNRYPALFLEGGDSVGKNELFRSIALRVLLADPTKKLLLMNFPQFWFFGHDIRLVLRGACDDLISGLPGVENATIRACLYGMDRNIALMLAEPYLSADPDIFVLSDRGPYSSCVTTGYLWANGLIVEAEVKEQIIPKVFNFADQGLLTYFAARSLLCLTNGQFNLGKRKALDNYESELPQKFSYEAYRMLELPEIVTRNGEEWRPRDELACEALQKAGFGNYACCPLQDPESIDRDQFLLHAYKEGRIILVGPQLFLKHFQVKHTSDKALAKLMDKWTDLSLDGGNASKRDRKELLDDVETKIALSLKRKTRAFDYLNTRKAPHATQAIARLFDQYPILFDILARTSGKAMTTFFEGLLSSEQLRLMI